jgi:hypothetical protein
MALGNRWSRTTVPCRFPQKLRNSNKKHRLQKWRGMLASLQLIFKFSAQFVLLLLAQSDPYGTHCRIELLLC